MDAEQFKQAREVLGMTQTELPPWAMDLPLKAAGWRGRRYRK